METQVGFFESILDLICLEQRFLIGGIVLIGASVYWMRKRKIRTLQSSLVLGVFYYYLAVVLSHIVGIPTIKEFMRLSALGESFFHPNINLIPFADGLSLEFLLNVLCFVPLGFFCPLISRTYEQAKNVLLIGFGFSFVIEISQLFTLYRATDINDLISNTLGTFLGYLCWRLIAKKRKKEKSEDGKSTASGLPVLYLAAVFVITFMQF